MPGLVQEVRPEIDQALKEGSIRIMQPWVGEAAALPVTARAMELECRLRQASIVVRLHIRGGLPLAEVSRVSGWSERQLLNVLHWLRRPLAEPRRRKEAPRNF